MTQMHKPDRLFGFTNIWIYWAAASSLVVKDAAKTQNPTLWLHQVMVTRRITFMEIQRSYTKKEG